MAATPVRDTSTRPIGRMRSMNWSILPTAPVSSNTKLSIEASIVMIAGYAAFVPGLAIVYFHNRWTGDWPVLVTIMGWLSLVVGLLRMVFPTQIAALTTKIAPSAAGVFPVVAVVFLLIGGFLSFKAYGRD
jgi:hypothetical protein